MRHAGSNVTEYFRACFGPARRIHCFRFGKMSTFEQDVKAYANYDAKFDTPIRQALANGDPRDAIRRIAGAYRVARNFPRRFDETLGIPRYEPVVSALAAYS